MYFVAILHLCHQVSSDVSSFLYVTDSIYMMSLRMAVCCYLGSTGPNFIKVNQTTSLLSLSFSPYIYKQALILKMARLCKKIIQGYQCL